VTVQSIRESWDFNDPAGSEARLRKLAEEAKEQGDTTLHLEALSQVARAMGLQGRFEEGHQVLDAAASQMTGTDEVPRLRLLLERGRLFNSGGDPERALPLFEEAWVLGLSIPHPDLAVDAAHMMAIVAPPGEKRAWNERALAYAESSGDPEASRWLGSLYNNMGWDAHDAGDFEEALLLHQKGWDWQRERQTGRGERIAEWSVAKQLRFLGRSEEAMDMQQALLARYVIEEPGGEGFVHEELGELYLQAGDEGQAATHFERAWELLRDIDWIEPERLGRMRELSQGVAG
jgi:tetratricopeptide (TPR) repeat protein